MRHVRQSGFAIISSLFVTVMVLLFGLTLAALASFQLHNVSHVVDHRIAFEAAQAGLACAMDSVARNPTWGQKGESLSGTVGSQGAQYSVTFQSAGTTAWSTNNLQSPNGVAGWQSWPVPPYSALLLSTGQSASGEKCVQAEIMQLQPYNYVVAATGQVTTGGHLNANGATTLLNMQANNLDATGSVYGGASGVSVTSSTASLITGQLNAVGTAQLAPSSQVLQGITENCSPNALPNISVATYSNQSMAGVVTLAAGTYPIPMVVSGPTYVPGNVTMMAGLVLLNANLYVAGDLTVQTLPMTGTGSVFVQGSATIQNSLTLSGSTTIALFSQGQLELNGDGFFQGLIYSNTGVHAGGHLQVVGGVFVDSSSGGNIVDDTDLDATYLPQYLSFGRSFITQSDNNRSDVKRLFWQEVQ